MARQWALPDGTLVYESGSRQWIASGVAVDEAASSSTLAITVTAAVETYTGQSIGAAGTRPVTAGTLQYAGQAVLVSRAIAVAAAALSYVGVFIGVSQGGSSIIARIIGGLRLGLGLRRR